MIISGVLGDLAGWKLSERHRTKWGMGCLVGEAPPQVVQPICSLASIGNITMLRTCTLAAALLLSLAFSASAQIYNWDTGEVIPGTEGITPGPYMHLDHWDSEGHNLRFADLSGDLNLHGSSFKDSWLDNAWFMNANLTDANFYSATLTNADLSGADLTDASFWGATLTNADLTGAQVAGANFWYTTDSGFTAAQLYSTASYQSGDLHGIGFRFNDLTGWNLAGQNLSDADFQDATLINVDLSSANLADAYFEDATLTNADLSSANLTDADFYRAVLADADLSSANLANAYLRSATLTDANLGSANLTNAYLRDATLTNADLSSANLTDAYFGSATLTNANLNSANLTNADFYDVTLTNADLTGAYVAGADFRSTTDSGFTSARLYSTASHQAGDLHGIGLAHNNLTGWNLTGQNLTDASFQRATLTDVDLTGAQVAGANFYHTTQYGFTAAQLYSTASYQAGDLHDIELSQNDLTGWNLAGQNLTNASFQRATLTDTDLTGAQVAGANFEFATQYGFTAAQLYSTASYQARDLHGIRLGSNDLTGWILAGQNLTGANFEDATLTNAYLIGAQVAGADFMRATDRGFTAAQLYSTASYQAGDLHGIGLSDNDLTGWNLADQNLTDADFGHATLTIADLRGANLTNASFHFSTLTIANLTGAQVAGADFAFATDHGFTALQFYSTASYQAGDLHGIGLSYNDLTNWNLAGQNLTDADFLWATLTDADLTGADTRGASHLNYSGAITDNAILTNGHVAGLDLTVGETLLVRDYAGGIPITIDYQMTMAPSSTLAIFLADAVWGSTMSLAGGFIADLDGTLLLSLAEDAEVDDLLGTTFDLFNWNEGLTPGDTFAQVTWPAGFTWDLSDLYTGGTVTLTAVPEPATIALLATGLLLLRRRR